MMKKAKKRSRRRIKRRRIRQRKGRSLAHGTRVNDAFWMLPDATLWMLRVHSDTPSDPGEKSLLLRPQKQQHKIPRMFNDNGDEEVRYGFLSIRYIKNMLTCLSNEGVFLAAAHCTILQDDFFNRAQSTRCHKPNVPYKNDHVTTPTKTIACQ